MEIDINNNMNNNDKSNKNQNNEELNTLIDFLKKINILMIKQSLMNKRNILFQDIQKHQKPV